MRKTLLALSFFIAITSVNIYAQKNKKDNKGNYNVELKNSVDSLSYAYGVTVAQQGLTEYLQQLGVISDTEKIRLEYNQKIDSATSNLEKQKLQDKLNSTLDSSYIANSKNLTDFIQGINARISSSNNKAYNSGFELGSQIQRLAEGFSNQMSNSPDQINVQYMASGIANVLQNKPILIEDAKTLVDTKVKEIQDKAQVSKEDEYAKVIAAGQEFMFENAKRNGVISLPSGLQYTIDKKGSGAIPKATDKVKVHYTGRLTNGTVFDSSVERGEPITFGLQQVIPGWTEILQLMPVGSKWTVYIPYNLAYGDRDMGAIKPYSNLIFEIELIDIEK